MKELNNLKKTVNLLHNLPQIISPIDFTLAINNGLYDSPAKKDFKGRLFKKCSWAFLGFAMLVGVILGVNFNWVDNTDEILLGNFKESEPKVIALEDSGVARGNLENNLDEVSELCLGTNEVRALARTKNNNLVNSELKGNCVQMQGEVFSSDATFLQEITGFQLINLGFYNLDYFENKIKALVSSCGGKYQDILGVADKNIWVELPFSSRTIFMTKLNLLENNQADSNILMLSLDKDNSAEEEKIYFKLNLYELELNLEP